jgi:hypothetical protein
MPPPLLRIFISNSSSLLSSPSSISSHSLQQLRNVSTKRRGPKTVQVQLTKNVPKLGLRGPLPSFSELQLMSLQAMSLMSSMDECEICCTHTQRLNTSIQGQILSLRENVLVYLSTDTAPKINDPILKKWNSKGSSIKSQCS